MGRKNPETVYKYAELETFKKIIENNSFLLFDIQKSNDTTELKLIYNIAEKVFDEEYDNKKPEYIKSYLPKSEYKEFIKNNTDRINVIEKMQHTHYATCFSANGDALSQWRGYTKDSDGLSIGIRVEAFKDNDRFNYDRVRYYEREQKALLREDIREMVKDIRSYVKSKKTIKGYSPLSFQNSYNTMILKSVLIKNQFFYEEKEWRLSHWDIKEKKSIEFKFAKEQLAEIIIGPKCKITKEEIEMVLKEKGYYNCKVLYSMGHGIYVDSQNCAMLKG